MQQFCSLYDYTGHSGNSVQLSDYAPSLSNYQFDNRLSSICITGIWIFYADPNYNLNNNGASNYWVFGDKYCTDVPSQFDNQASSVRYTGAPDGWKADTLNVYMNEYFIGGEEYTYTDITNFKNNDQTKSLIVTGCNAWTLYEYSNYKGRCKCVYPASSSDCTPGFYTNESSLGQVARTISSARKGCYCNSRALPDNYGVQSDGNGAHGFFHTTK